MIDLPWTDLMHPDPSMPGRGATGQLIRALAALQHGVVARWQLLQLGVPAGTISDRAARGELVALHRGVYAVAHAHVTLAGRNMGAVLAAGPDTALSLYRAAAVHALRPTSSPTIDVTRVGCRRRIPGIRVHLTRAWHPDDVVLVDGVPVTSVCRTIIDLADVLTPEGLDAVLAEAERQQLDASDMDAAVARTCGRRGPGPARLAAARARLAAHGAVYTRSDGEIALRAILREASLPEPVMNLPVGRDELDAGWPGPRCGIELDSWEFHDGRVRFVRDRAKLRRLTLAGWKVLPFSGADLKHRPGLVARQAADLLHSRPA